MTWNATIRQGHRWLSAAFTLAVAANFAAMALPAAPAWLVYVPLPPLLALMLTGLWMFVLPHARAWRGRRHCGGAE